MKRRDFIKSIGLAGLGLMITKSCTLPSSKGEATNSTEFKNGFGALWVKMIQQSYGDRGLKKCKHME